MAAVRFYGFETGDLSETPVTVGSVTIVSSPVISGNYAAKIQSSAANPGSVQCVGGLNKSTLCIRARIYIHVTTNPASQADFVLIAFRTAADGNIAGVSCLINTDGTIALYGIYFPGGNFVGPSSVSISVDTVYTIEMKLVVSTTVGFVEWKINSAVQGTVQNVSTGSTNVDYVIQRMLLGTGDAYCVLDDVLIDDANYPGLGRCIARQGTIGTPTYDTFTKVVGATATECWSETPFSATKSCTSIVNGGAQTMLAGSFANIQTGHGTEKFWTGKGLTINACKVAMIAKVGVGSSHSIRRRLNGVDTDTAETITTSDAYYDDGIWTDTLANINSMEIGVLHGANVNLLTIEDMWIMIDVEKRWILGPH